MMLHIQENKGFLPINFITRSELPELLERWEISTQNSRVNNYKFTVRVHFWLINTYNIKTQILLRILLWTSLWFWSWTSWCKASSSRASISNFAVSTQLILMKKSFLCCLVRQRAGQARHALSCCLKKKTNAPLLRLGILWLKNSDRILFIKISLSFLSYRLLRMKGQQSTRNLPRM